MGEGDREFCLGDTLLLFATFLFTAAVEKNGFGFSGLDSAFLIYSGLGSTFLIVKGAVTLELLFLSWALRTSFLTSVFLMD